MSKRPIVGFDWPAFWEESGEAWLLRTVPEVPTMAPELADAFNTCQLSMQLAGWAVSDDHFCERFREEKPFGEFRGQFA